jgi:hypothetical protein
MFADVSEEPTASIFRVEFERWKSGADVGKEAAGIGALSEPIRTRRTAEESVNLKTMVSRINEI